MRLFVAVVPPLPLREAIAQSLEAAGNELRVRWIPVANLHLTLAFLGEVAPARLPAVEAAARATAGAHTAFPLVLQALGAFDSLRRARVLFLGSVQGEPALARVAADLLAALPADLRPADRRRFAGHLTLARPKAPPDAAALQRLAAILAPQAFTFTVDRLAVVESQLAPGGSRYTQRSSHPLRKGD